jgi:hypothetical protein
LRSLPREDEDEGSRTAEESEGEEREVVFLLLGGGELRPPKSDESPFDARLDEIQISLLGI